MTLSSVLSLENLSRQVCTLCVMDDSDPQIRFDFEGVCSHCHEAAPRLAAINFSQQESKQKLLEAGERIRRISTGCGYDAVVGVSGGVDSSYLLWLSKQLDLRILAVHFDNGWNTEIAVANIEKVVKSCGFDLETYVIDWPEFRDLQRAFLKAGVVDIEMLTDHALTAAMFELAARHGIRVVLSGTNIATEFGMPRAWVWNKQDLRNIKSIHRQFGTIKLKSYPQMGLFKSLLRRHLGLRMEFVELLDMANFRKAEAVETLMRETGWRPYGGKHYETVFTRFYQAYILPTKFGIDKRRVHLSALIRNGEITREHALQELATPLYAPDDLRRDKSFVLKKLGFSEAEFDDMMRTAPVPHDAYGSDKKLRDLLKSMARRAGLLQ